MAFILKNLEFSDVMLAPMAGVTDAPFREMVRRFGTELVFSEMILADSLTRAHRRTTQMALPSVADSPIAIQLVGHDPETMAQAARIVEEQAAFIDLNMGCPVHKIVRSGSGSDLMQNEELAEKIVRRVVEAVKVPVTVKFRLGWNEESKNFLDFGRRMADAGAAGLILHARTRAQHYSGQADWAAIGLLKKAVAIPVVANGDIRSKADADRVKNETGADGVMVGRGALGKPWILAQIKAGQKFVRPALKQIVLDHFALMEKYYSSKAIFIARKHIAWYSLGIGGGAAFREQINQMTDPSAVKKRIEEFFGTEND